MGDICQWLVTFARDSRRSTPKYTLSAQLLVVTPDTVIFQNTLASIKGKGANATICRLSAGCLGTQAIVRIKEKNGPG